MDDSTMPTAGKAKSRRHGYAEPVLLVEGSSEREDVVGEVCICIYAAMSYALSLKLFFKVEYVYFLINKNNTYIYVQLQMTVWKKLCAVLTHCHQRYEKIKKPDRLLRSRCSGAQLGGGGAGGVRPLLHFILWLRICL